MYQKTSYACDTVNSSTCLVSPLTLGNACWCSRVSRHWPRPSGMRAGTVLGSFLLWGKNWQICHPLRFTLDFSCCTVETAAVVPVVRTAMLGSRETAHAEFFLLGEWRASLNLSFSKGKYLVSHLAVSTLAKMVLEFDTWNFVSLYKRSVNIMCFSFSCLNYSWSYKNYKVGREDWGLRCPRLVTPGS